MSHCQEHILQRYNMCKNNHTTRCTPKVWHPGRADLDKNQLRHDVICIPWDTIQRGRRLIEMIINHAYQIIGHYGQWKTSNYIWCSYKWPQMATDIEAFCRSCRKCQTNKTDTQKPQGLLHSLPIPDKPWQLVGIDFMGPLPQSQGNDHLLVIIDQLMSQIHLVPTTTWVTAREVARLFLKEGVRLHRVPESIVSDCDTKFMSTFWCELHKLMGTKLLMSTAFHPQMDGTIERANCSIVWECSSRMIRRIGQPNAQW